MTMNQQDYLTDLGMLAVVTRLKRASDAMIHDGRRMYKELGLDIEPNWFAVFKLLRTRGPLSIMEIADAIGLSHPSVITMINKMSKAGYLVESRTASDSRRRILSLTPRAEERVPEFERVWNAGTAGFKRMMSDTDVLGMLNVLETRIAEKGFRRRTIEELENLKPVKVVEYNDRYAGDFARLNYEWIEKAYTVEKHDREILDAPFKQIVKPGGQIFFALVGRKVAGTVALVNINKEEFELAKMAVSPDFHGFGISNELMTACVACARKKNKKRIILESNTKQMAAIRLYRKFGFRETPLDPNSQFVRANIRMELAINGSDR